MSSSCLKERSYREGESSQSVRKTCLRGVTLPLSKENNHNSIKRYSLRKPQVVEGSGYRDFHGEGEVSILQSAKFEGRTCLPVAYRGVA